MTLPGPGARPGPPRRRRPGQGKDGQAGGLTFHAVDLATDE